MISNYFTFLHVARSINSRCTGMSIAEIYTQDKRRLAISLSGPSLLTVFISCVPSENALYLAEGTQRARQNAADLFPALIGKTLSGAVCDGTDRVVSLRCADGSELRAEFFGVRANVIAYDADGAPIDCFLGAGERLEAMPRALPLAPLPDRAETIVGTAQSLIAAFRAGEKKTSLTALKSAVPKLGTTAASELLLASHIDPG